MSAESRNGAALGVLIALVILLGFGDALILKSNADNAAQTNEIQGLVHGNHQTIHNLVDVSVQQCHDDRQRLAQYKIRGKFDLRTAEIQSRVFRAFAPFAPSPQAKRILTHGVRVYARFAHEIRILPLPNCHALRRELRSGIRGTHQGLSFRHAATAMGFPLRKGVVAHSGSSSPGHKPGPPPGGPHKCLPDNPLGVKTLPVCPPLVG